MKISIARLALGLLVGLAPASASRAQPAPDFYATHPITLISSFAAGGFNDLATRLIARHFGRFVPGDPNIIVKNMPGAGGIIAANHLFQVAARDGTVLGQLDRGVPQAGFRGAPNVKFDPLEFTWLGSLSTYANEACILWVRKDHPAKTVADLRNPKIQTRLGTITGATNHLLSKISKKVLDLNVDVVTGYPGAGPIWIALLNGELDGQVIGTSSVESSHPDLLQNGGIRPLVQFGRTTRMAGYENVPTGVELAKDENARALVEFAELPFLTSLPLAAPPNIPVERYKTLDAAFQAMIIDPAFIADAKQMRIEISPIAAGPLNDLLRKYAKTSKSVIEQYNQIIDSDQ
ncbi:MAG: family tricarboxylate transporter, receptor protein [Hyphomicrobiales bacterium]|nr:family tricarboxylate transporter, receptor protein [Hyphomicrobiales bacterium]